jgi:NAD(P)-dependent dehydrogenase (short-subunit alcohol dehydrogenase family)
LAQEGASVVLAEINLETAERVAGEIRKKGGKALAIKTDVSQEESVNQMVTQSVDSYGRVDILVNNAAIYYGLQYKSILEISTDEWDRIQEVNLKGPFLCSKAVIPYMKLQGKGKIVNQSSGVFHVGVPYMLHYVTSKGGLISMTRALARELGEFNINVNAIAPGLVLSDAGKLRGQVRIDNMRNQRSIKKDILPGDLLGTLVFLCSDESDMITGQTIIVDGGQAFS